VKAFTPVIIESRYAGNVERNLRYLRACMRDCLLRGEAPLASHALYTQSGVLDDSDPVERDMGIAAGFAWRPLATLTVFYVDLGWSKGMREGLLDCEIRKLPWEERLLGGVWKS
jgi:hypothetical protein